MRKALGALRFELDSPQRNITFPQPILASFKADSSMTDVVGPGHCLDKRIKGTIVDAIATGDGPDDRARNAVESSRDWRAPVARRRSRFTRPSSRRFS